MKDFQIRNSTKLLFRNDLSDDFANIIKSKKVLFIYGGGSVHKNGCYNDIKGSVLKGNGQFFEFKNASREAIDIEKGIKFSQLNNVDLLIGAGGGSVMDATKIISLGHFNPNFLEILKEEKSLEEVKHLPFILIPTYPSSGSENIGCAAVTKEGNFYFAYGLSAEYSFLVPKYSLSLNQEMTSYSSLTVIVQLSMVVFGDKNPISYDFGISVIKNVLKAAIKLKTEPNDLKARGVILFGASISTSELIAIEKDVDYSSDFYFLEIMLEPLFNTTYRKALTSLFPAYLKYTAKLYENEVKTFLSDAFNFTGSVDDSINRLVQLFNDFGIDLFFHEHFSEEILLKIPNQSSFEIDQIKELFNDMIKLK